jgi:hypothetical protein
VLEGGHRNIAGMSIVQGLTSKAAYKQFAQAQSARLRVQRERFQRGRPGGYRGPLLPQPFGPALLHGQGARNFGAPFLPGLAGHRPGRLGGWGQADARQQWPRYA